LRVESTAWFGFSSRSARSLSSAMPSVLSGGGEFRRRAQAAQRQFFEVTDVPRAKA
jgi:hypothetical protein